ncbi:MAG: DNA methyltransferase [Candidatus Nitrosopolaris sp.]
MQSARSKEVDDSWSFRDLSRLQTSYITHDYHRYPAKFIPQLASRVIKENSNVGDLICDPFVGSGTTLIEAIVNGRRAYGTDINPVSVLISKAKTTLIDPLFLQQQASSLLAKIKSSIANRYGQMLLVTDNFDVKIPNHKRLDYWFPEEQKNDLATILSIINTIDDERVRIFSLCAFSNILKGCSNWMTKSVKPTRDKRKITADAYKSYVFQIRKMVVKNGHFWNMLARKDIPCVVDDNDARKMKISNNSATLIVTSPPYVTSYEYADLHQLTAIWLGYADSLSEFRSKFIGSIQKDNRLVKLYSKTGRETADKLRSVDKREADGVEQYFFEMQEFFVEMHRVLKRCGKAAIVIGDTDLKKVEIQNANVFAETMENIGFKTYKIIRRPIPSKILPLTRDEKTGRFASTSMANRLAYPIENILIMEKI